jgi:hypothetical protein
MSYIALATTTLGSAAANVTFSSIPTSVNGVALRDLILVIDCQTTANADGWVRFNSDAGTNYSVIIVAGTFSAAVASQNQALIGYGLANTRKAQVIQIMDYSATDKHKTFLSRTNNVADNAGMFSARWANTNAINTILVSGSAGNYAAGSTFSLYGVA